MTLDDVMPDPSELDTPIFTGEQIRRYWPQARYELLVFARHLERTDAPLTADQIKLAVALASIGFLQWSEGGGGAKTPATV